MYYDFSVAVPMTTNKPTISRANDRAWSVCWRPVAGAEAAVAEGVGETGVGSTVKIMLSSPLGLRL